MRAGLELVAAVSALKTHAALQTRVGIATGLVVVGDLIGSGASQEQAIVGETPNLAARLQGIAEPNSVVIAESTRKLVGNLFELEDLGATRPQGYCRACESLGRVTTSFSRKPFRGFPREWPDRTCRARRRTRNSACGAGRKQRPAKVKWCCSPVNRASANLDLTAALLERMAAEPHTRLRYFCSPQHTDSALYPIIGQMERAAGFTQDDTPQAKLDKLDALLAQSFDVASRCCTSCGNAVATERRTLSGA